MRDFKIYPGYPICTFRVLKGTEVAIRGAHQRPAKVARRWYRSFRMAEVVQSNCYILHFLTHVESKGGGGYPFVEFYTQHTQRWGMRANYATHSYKQSSKTKQWWLNSPRLTVAIIDQPIWPGLVTWHSLVHRSYPWVLSTGKTFRVARPTYPR